MRQKKSFLTRRSFLGASLGLGLGLIFFRPGLTAVLHPLKTVPSPAAVDRRERQMTAAILRRYGSELGKLTYHA